MDRELPADSPERLLSLGMLAHQNIDDRFQAVINFGRNELDTAILGARSLDPHVFSSIDLDRLAWVIAYNIRPPSSRTREGISTGNGYVDHWPSETPWAEIWAKLTREHDRTSLLTELALSVACEHRDDWQPLGCQVNRDLANQAFELVYNRGRSRVTGIIWSAFGRRPGNPEDIADEAWARVFRDYWSINAQRRFLGLSRISTLVGQVARFVALDVFRDQEKYVHIADSTADDEQWPTEAVVHELGIEQDPTDEIHGKRMWSQLEKCMKSLTAKQQIVSTMVWLNEKSASDAAAELGISESAVSQHLSKAREGLRKCLNAHGFRILLARGQSSTVQ